MTGKPKHRIEPHRRLEQMPRQFHDMKVRNALFHQKKEKTRMNLVYMKVGVSGVVNRVLKIYLQRNTCGALKDAVSMLFQKEFRNAVSKKFSSCFRSVSGERMTD